MSVKVLQSMPRLCGVKSQADRMYLASLDLCFLKSQHTNFSFQPISCIENEESINKFKLEQLNV